MNILRAVFLALLVLSFTACSTAKPKQDLTPVVELIQKSPVEYADDQLRKDGMSEDFIRTIHKRYLDGKKDWETSAASIIELNVFGFLYHSNYFLHDSPKARKKTLAYIKGHRESFKTASTKYHVDPKVIASLVWVETKLGKTTGSFELPWVFYSMILGSHPDFSQKMVALLPKKAEQVKTANLTMELARIKVVDRCKSKATWALGELKAIQEIAQTRAFNPFKTKSSFAGAFGIPQFIPSTYLKQAVSEFRKTPDLFKHSDAILSVANFLNANGWSTPEQDARTKALFSYNRSKDYGSVILQIAQALPDLKMMKATPVEQAHN